MIEDILKCSTPDELMSHGINIITKDRLSELGFEIAENKYLFLPSEYWHAYHMEYYSVEDLLTKSKNEDTNDKVRLLHRLQILMQYCPDTRRGVKWLLEHTTAGAEIP